MTRTAGWLPIREAWQQALYGPAGFYRRQTPGDHFRTSVHASPQFAGALVELVRRLGIDTVTDVGAGSGELLGQLHALAPDLNLLGVELRARPSGLPPPVRWELAAAPVSQPLSGLVIANEVLDNIACEVLEVDVDGVVRVVEVHRASAAERLGAPASPSQHAWLEKWWPLRTPGQRAEVGATRDAWWEGICTRNPAGVCLAVDFGHTKAHRPFGGGLAAYRRGRQVAVRFDGKHDVTTHVAVDAVAAAVGARVVSQHEALVGLGVSASRPPADLARSDPAAYVRQLASHGAADELTASPGLGDFAWILSPGRQTRHLL